MCDARHADPDDEQDLIAHESEHPDRHRLPGDGMLTPARVSPSEGNDREHADAGEDIPEPDDNRDRQLAHGIFGKNEVARPKQEQESEQQIE